MLAARTIPLNTGNGNERNAKCTGVWMVAKVRIVNFTSTEIGLIDATCKSLDERFSGTLSEPIWEYRTRTSRVGGGLPAKEEYFSPDNPQVSRSSPVVFNTYFKLPTIGSEELASTGFLITLKTTAGEYTSETKIPKVRD